MWRETTKHERNMKIFQDELDEFLPETILDFHVHIFNEGVVPRKGPYSCGGHDINKYDLDDFIQDLKEVYPGRKTRAVCFGFPHTDYDIAKNNQYIVEKCAGERFFPFRLFDPTIDTPNSFHKDLIAGKYYGIKPYPDYVRKQNINDVEIHEMLPNWAMDIINELGLLVMLHIPRRGRLADPLNQKQLVELCNNYPNAKVVLAHIGRAYFLQNIVGNLTNLKNLPNLFFDLTMLSNWEVLEYLFQEVDEEKIIYGTDTPIALAPGKAVEINNQYTYVTPVPWDLSIYDNHKKLLFTSFLYEELRAIKKATERTGKGKAFIQKIFHTNGMALLDSISNR